MIRDSKIKQIMLFLLFHDEFILREIHDSEGNKTKLKELVPEYEPQRG